MGTPAPALQVGARVVVRAERFGERAMTWDARWDPLWELPLTARFPAGCASALERNRTPATGHRQPVAPRPQSRIELCFGRSGLVATLGDLVRFGR
jgi:hypothetical protein